jgi:hypothetical protein
LLLLLTLTPALGACVAGAGAAAAVGFGVQAAEAAGVVTASAAGGNQRIDSDDRAARCDQLSNSPPYVAQIAAGRLWPWTLQEVGEDARWAPASLAPSASLSDLHFTPPLAHFDPSSKKKQFLAYAPMNSQTIADSEQLTSLVGSFETAAGTFSLESRVYRYALVNKLPCFPLAR